MLFLKMTEIQRKMLIKINIKILGILLNNQFLRSVAPFEKILNISDTV